jgi:hypothetical protein
MLRTRLAAIAMVLLLVACSGRDSGETDTAETDIVATDANVSWDDVDGAQDTLSPETDAETSLGDTPGDDAMVENDTDVPSSDSDSAEAETIAPVEVAEDAADVADNDMSAPQDTAPNELLEPEVGDSDGGSAEDTDPGPVGENVLAHGSFEAWVDGLPVGWVGTTTNLSSSGIAEETGIAHDGIRSCRLSNADDSHKRFSTEPMALLAGKYSCRYWVRGEGEVRNARYTDDDYSNYSGYMSVSGDLWESIDYAFNVAADAEAFELIFSVRNTSEAGLVVDDVRCVRAEQACDTVVCEDWQVCENPDGDCVSAPGKCADDSECASWQDCGSDHECALSPGACASTADCDGETPVCDLDTHTCAAGDPCDGVDCQDWQVCEPSDASCVPAEGRCVGLADCDQALPACDLGTHTCVAVDAPVNVVPNGGFEAWSDVVLGRSTEFLLPDHWYGVCDGCMPYWPTTEIDANNIKPYTVAPHSGDTALQLIEAMSPAERFVSEPFAVTAGVTYPCAYWVRGHGSYRQRGYCGGWNVDTDFQTIDSDEWQQVTFELGGSSSWCVLILYASNTDADRDHLQFDDVVCIAP